MTTHFQFATIELMPYPELGEFVIVGVLAASKKGEVATKIMPMEVSQRLTQFFPEIDQSVLASALDTVSASFAKDQFGDGVTDRDAMFQVFTSSREGMIRFTKRGAGTTEDHQAMDKLRSRYQRSQNFAKPPPTSPSPTVQN